MTIAAGSSLVPIALGLALLAALSALFVAAVLRQPWIAPVVLSASLSLDRIVSLGRLSISDLALALALAAILIRVRVQSDVPVWRYTGAVPFILLFAWVALASLGDLGREREVSWFTFAAQASIVLVFPFAIGTPQQLSYTIFAYWIGGAIAVIVGWAQILYFLLFGVMLFPVDRPWLYLGFVDSIVFRMSGGLENPAQFAFFLVFPTCSLIAWLILRARMRIVPRGILWLLALAVLLATGVLASFTRGAVLAVIIASVGAFAMTRQNRPAWLMAGAALSVVALEPLLWTVRQAAEINLGSIGARQDVIAASVRIWLESPLFGHGLGTRVEIPGGTRHFPHSALLQSALDGGAVGALLFVGGLAFLSLRLIQGLRRATLAKPSALTALAYAVTVGLTATLVQTLFLDPTLHLKALWVPVGLGIAASNMMRLRSRAANVAGSDGW